MPNQPLDEREFELVNIIGAKLASNQRDLSKHLDLSLGQTNMLIKRLVSKGYIRITQLNKKKVKYLLTPKGIAEKMKKSVKYTMKTINSIGLIRDRLKKIVLELKDKGEFRFMILGSSDLAALVKMSFKENFDKEHVLINVEEIPREENGTLLICKEGYENGKCNYLKSINLLEEIAKDNIFV